jgi:hypothetical protein
LQLHPNNHHYKNDKDRKLGQLTMTPVSLIPQVCHDDLLQVQWNVYEGFTNSAKFTYCTIKNLDNKDIKVIM